MSDISRLFKKEIVVAQGTMRDVENTKMYSSLNENYKALQSKRYKEGRKRGKREKRMSNNGGSRSCFILYIDPLVSSKRLTMNKLVSRKLLGWSMMSANVKC
jgi:hypothetical protein